MNRTLKKVTAATIVLAIAAGASVQAAETPAAAGTITAPADAADVCPIKVGSPLPRLSLTGLDGEPFDLNAVVGKKPTVLVFYRGGWCPYCNTQLGQLKAVEPQLLKLGYQLLAVSPDLPEELRKSAQKQELKYSLLSDSKMTAAQALGIAFKVDDATYTKYKGYNIDLEKSSGEKHHLLPEPAVFVIATDGTIHFSYINPNYAVRLNPAVLLAAAKAALPAPATRAGQAKKTGK